MACKKCDYKGYIIQPTIRDGGIKNYVTMCPHCQDITAYSNYIQSIARKNIEEVKEPKENCNVISLDEYKKRR